MSKCIICGNELQFTYVGQFAGWKCLNCKTKDGTSLEWTLAEHKDNQNWTVRHLRIAEAKIIDLENIIMAQQQQIIDLATQIKELKNEV